MGDLSDFERGQIVVACLTGVSATSGVSRAEVSKVMSEYMNHGKTT
jgi:hypothetical protein